MTGPFSQPLVCSVCKVIHIRRLSVRPQHQDPKVAVAGRRSEATEAPLVLPGEDPNPLRWVENVRKAAEDADVGSGQKRRFRRHVQHSVEPDIDADSPALTESPATQLEPVISQSRVVLQSAAAQFACGPVDVGKYLGQQQGLEAVLDACESIWPAWADNGCRRLGLQGQGTVDGPAVSEAAAALEVIADTMLRNMSGGARMLQARDRRIIGLVEALRVLPPRPPPGLGSQIIEESSDRSSGNGHGNGSITANGLVDTAVPSATAFTDTLEAAATQEALNSTSAKPLHQPPSNDAYGEGDAAAKHSPRMHPVARTQALYALAVIGGPIHFRDEMTELVEQADLRPLRRKDRPIWRPRRVVDALWALGLAHHWTQRLPEFEALLVSSGGIAACTPREATSCLWAFATLGHQPHDLLREVGHTGWRFAHKWNPARTHSSRSLRSASPKQLASLAWSLAATQMVNTAAFAEIWAELGRRGPDQMRHSVNNLMQVHQAALSARLEGGEQYDTELPQMQQLLSVAQQQWDASTKTEHTARESFYEAQVASTLVGLGIFHVVEDRASGYAVDMSLPEDRIVIEVDGPSHMARTQQDQRLGHTLLKLRHLTGLGWKVVSVPFYEWDELTGPEEKRSYLLGKIEAARAQ